MGICNGIAGAVAPVILGAVILSDADALSNKLSLLNPVQKIAALDELANKVILPYLIITVVLAILAIVIYFSALPEIDEEEAEEGLKAAEQTTKTSIFQFPHLWLGVIVLQRCWGFYLPYWPS